MGYRGDRWVGVEIFFFLLILILEEFVLRKFEFHFFFVDLFAVIKKINFLGQNKN
jgi:hypothetical protein